MANEHVNNPVHYGGADNPYEAIKVIEAWELDFCLGNTIKYISRAGKKEPEKVIEDLEKAKWYLERKIASLKDDEWKNLKVTRQQCKTSPQPLSDGEGLNKKQ